MSGYQHVGSVDGSSSNSFQAGSSSSSTQRANLPNNVPGVHVSDWSMEGGGGGGGAHSFMSGMDDTISIPYFTAPETHKNALQLAKVIVGCFVFLIFLSAVTNKHGNDDPMMTGEINPSPTPVTAPVELQVPEQQKQWTKTEESDKTLAELNQHHSALATEYLYDNLNHALNMQKGKSEQLTAVPQGCEATVMLMRHAEKTDFELGETYKERRFMNEYLNYVGFQRALYLSTLFASSPEMNSQQEKSSDDSSNGSSSGNGNRKMANIEFQSQEQKNQEQQKINNMADAQATQELVKEEKKIEGEVLVESEIVAGIVALTETERIISRMLSRWPQPSYLYALHPDRSLVDYAETHRTSGAGKTQKKNDNSNSKRMNYREIQTLIPLSEKFNTTIKLEVKSEDLASEIYSKLNSGEMCGKVAVVSWDHESIPHLAQILGCGPFQGCPLEYRASEFDQVWQLKYVYAPLVLPEFDVDNFQDDKDVSVDNLEEYHEWMIQGNVAYQKFDPLEFGYRFGLESGGKWMREAYKATTKPYIN